MQFDYARLWADVFYRDDPRPEPDAPPAVLGERLSAALVVCNNRERRCIEGRYGLERLTYRALGNEFGVSPERIRQHTAKALRRLRAQRQVLLGEIASVLPMEPFVLTEATRLSELPYRGLLEYAAVSALLHQVPVDGLFTVGTVRHLSDDTLVRVCNLGVKRILDLRRVCGPFQEPALAVELPSWKTAGSVKTTLAHLHRLQEETW